MYLFISKKVSKSTDDPLSTSRCICSMEQFDLNYLCHWYHIVFTFFLVVLFALCIYVFIARRQINVSCMPKTVKKPRAISEYFLYFHVDLNSSKSNKISEGCFCCVHQILIVVKIFIHFSVMLQIARDQLNLI